MIRFRPGIWPTLTVALGLPVLLMLGTWQVQRLGWKTDLIATLEARYAEAPVALPTTAELGPEWSHRPVRVTAVLQPEPALRFRVARQDGRPGHFVLQRADLADGRVIVVNRGWLANEARAPDTPMGDVELTGSLQWIEDAARVWPTPENDAAGNRWFWYDPAVLEQVLGGPLIPVVLEVSEAPSESAPSVPVPQPLVVELSNNHLGYAVTWYGLAASLLAIYGLYGVRRGREMR